MIAHELDLDCYRVDLSAVVSKYIGETERNLRRVFDAAEAGGAVLVFDEADALWGKRSEVRDSHDRYANIEVSYLLQRMEAYRGLAILTTNMRRAIDSGVHAPLRFVVEFPFPDATQRAAIWRAVVPAARRRWTDVDFATLARLEVAGGAIRNIALHAAFLAADDGAAVSHGARAARGARRVREERSAAHVDGARRMGERAPPRVRIDIGRLVLDGVAARDVPLVRAAFERELRALVLAGSQSCAANATSRRVRRRARGTARRVVPFAARGRTRAGARGVRGGYGARERDGGAGAPERARTDAARRSRAAPRSAGAGTSARAGTRARSSKPLRPRSRRVRMHTDDLAAAAARELDAHAFTVGREHVLRARRVPSRNTETATRCSSTRSRTRSRRRARRAPAQDAAGTVAAATRRRRETSGDW